MSTPVTIDDIYKLFQASKEEYDRRAAEADRRMIKLEKTVDRNYFINRQAYEGNKSFL